MSDKGGGDSTTTTTMTPWGPLQAPLQNLIRRAETLSGRPPDYFPGETFVGALPEELAGFRSQLDFANQVFGGGAAPDFGSAVDAQNILLGGGPAAGLYGAVGPAAAANIAAQFAGPNIQIGSYAPAFTPSGVSLGFNAPAGIDPTVTADPNQAIERMLSGTPDFSGVEASIRAFADPVLDILNEDILPGLASRGVALNNPTGEIKEANRIIPRVMRDIANQGALITEQERQRALGAQERAAQLATQAGLSQTGLGLDASRIGLGAAQTQAGLDQNLQNLLTQLGLAAPEMEMQADVARQGALDRYRGDVLGLLGAAGGLAGDQAQNMAAGISALPGLTQLGMTPGTVLGGYGQFLRGIEEAELSDAINRFNFQEQAPFNMVDWLARTLTGVGGGFGTQTQVQEAPDANPLLGALGLATTIGSFIPGPWTPFAMGANALMR